MKEDKQVLYFYMILVTIGTVLIALAIMKSIFIVNEGYLMLVIGFVLTINYINYLEKNRNMLWELTLNDIRKITIKINLLGSQHILVVRFTGEEIVFDVYKGKKWIKEILSAKSNNNT